MPPSVFLKMPKHRLAHTVVEGDQRVKSKRGKRSQRKGRNGERELRDIFKAAGYQAITRGIYEPHDLRIMIRGKSRHIECKREARGLAKAYAAFAAGDYAVCFRSDNHEWLIIQRLADYLIDNGPARPASVELDKHLLSDDEQDETDGLIT